MPPTNLFPLSEKNSSEPVTQGQCGVAAQMTILMYECIFTGQRIEQRDRNQAYPRPPLESGAEPDIQGAP